MEIPLLAPFTYFKFVPLLILYVFSVGFLCNCLCVCVWWFRTLCSWEQMAKLMNLKNLVLENARTQCSDRMWHWNMGFYIICIMFWTCYFMLFLCKNWTIMFLFRNVFILLFDKFLTWWLTWMWTFYPHELICVHWIKSL